MGDGKVTRSDKHSAPTPHYSMLVVAPSALAIPISRVPGVLALAGSCPALGNANWRGSAQMWKMIHVTCPR